MSKKIIIKESQLGMVLTYLNEGGLYSGTVDKIKHDLDLNYEPQVVTNRKGGEYHEGAGFRIKADNELIDGKALLSYLLQKYDDVGEEFLKQLIRDWADGNIENGMLTKNMSMQK